MGKAGDDPVGQINGDIVHHDGAGDLVDVHIRLQETGDSAPHACEEHGRQHTQKDVYDRGQTQIHDAEHGGADSAQVHIALDTGVPHTGLDTDGHADAAQQQRGGTYQHITDSVLTAESTLDQSAVCREGVDTGDGDQNAAGHQTQNDTDEGAVERYDHVAEKRNTNGFSLFHIHSFTSTFWPSII